MLEIVQLLSLINEPESDYHDFKEKLYKKEQKSELVKDIFSFVNTTHENDCYIILGISDDGELVGIENDENRKNQQNLIDFISHLPIANDAIPKIYLESFDLDEHTIDVIVIPNTKNVPIYLSSKYPSKRQDGRQITPGIIYSRIGDVNTSIDSITNFYQVEELWRKHFRLNVPIQTRYEFILKDVKNWSYIHHDENHGFIYNLDPDFFVAIEEDDECNCQVELCTFCQITLCTFVT